MLFDNFLPSIPAPMTTVPQWVACAIIVLSSWFVEFWPRGKPAVVLRAEKEERKRIEQLMEATLAHAKEQEAKPEKDRKLPEAERVLELLCMPQP